MKLQLPLVELVLELNLSLLLLREVVSLSLQRIKFTLQMVHSNLEVIVALAQSDWLVPQLYELGLKLIKVLSESVLLRLKPGVDLSELDRLLLFLLDLVVVLNPLLFEVLDEPLVVLDLWHESVLLVLFLLLDAGLDLFLLHLELVFLGPEVFLPLVDGVDFLLDLDDLVVELLEQGFVLGLLTLGLFELQKLNRQLLLETPGFFHQHLLVLHVLHQGLVQLVELLLGLLGSVLKKEIRKQLIQILE